jgi:rhodanese-related sulfurtransferase
MRRFSINRFIITVFIFLIYGVVLADTPDYIDGTVKVSAEELIELAEKFDNLILIDARKRKDREGGYIEGSVLLTDVNTNEISLAEAVPTKDTPILFYCNGSKCRRSAISAKKAVSLGYTQIYWFRGGWEEWIAKGLPVSE